MLVVINKCFLLNPERNLAQIRLVVFEKNAKNVHFNSKKMTSVFGIKDAFFCVFLENDKTDLRQFFVFQGLEENTCLLQLSKKSALGL